LTLFREVIARYGRIQGMEDRPEERRELLERGRYALKHPDETEPRGNLHRYSLFLRLWRYPSFEPWISWAIFEPGRYADDANALHVRQITWDQQCDLGRFADPMEWLRQGYRAPPTLRVADTAVSSELLKPYQDELARACIPLFPREDFITLDGEERGVETYGFAVSARVVWRPGRPRDTPPALLNLERLMDLLTELFGRAEAK
jgi:hypothetical protein